MVVVGGRVDQMVISAQDGEEIASFLRRIKPHGHVEEERVVYWVDRLEQNDAH